MENKRGQMALILILTVLIIAAVVVLIFFQRKTPPVGGETFSPENFLRTCMEPQIKPITEIIASKGGYVQPQGVLTYKGDEIKYLCYTSEYYKSCIVQEPFIKERFESELNSQLQQIGEQCKQELVSEYQRRGYSVSASATKVKVSFSPHQMNVVLDAPITVTKEQAQTFKSLIFNSKSEMYDLLLISTSIVSYETSYGDSETSLYIQYYPDIIIEKMKLSDGSKIYTLRNVVTGESFRFASRSLSWPAGYFGA